MNRRQLFAALGAVALAPGELFVPSRKIFLPPRGGWVPAEVPVEVSGGTYARVAVTSALANWAGSVWTEVASVKFWHHVNYSQQRRDWRRDMSRGLGV